MNRASSLRSSHAAPVKNDRRPATRLSGVGSTLIGVFVGIALGLALAAGVAFYLVRAGNPYQPSVTANARDAKDPTRSGKVEGGAEKPRFDFYKILPGVEEPKLPAKIAERPPPDKATIERAAAPPEKATIERGGAPPEKAAPKADEMSAAVSEKAGDATARTPKATDRFWLQAGSFANEREAENLKAQLALAGWEAAIQSATLPDKSVRYRVRLGPYMSTDELNRAKGDLSKRGVEVAVIKY
jgi:cell division protein FtsN